MSSETRPFGPFTNVPSEDVKSAGFICYECRHLVERLHKAFPSQVVRMFFFVCQCGVVATWEDEAQPTNSRIWKLNVRLMKSAGVQFLIFNGNRPLFPNFSGTN